MLALLALLACGDKPTDSADPDPVDQDGDGYLSDVDCDDDDPDVHPGADERCDGYDTDCDGLTSDPDSVDATVWYLDGDKDGWGDETQSRASCQRPDLYVDQPGDCDDRDAGVNPDAQEVCDIDDQDEDCDGLSDDADDSVDLSTGTTYYADADQDGYGDQDDPGSPYCDASSLIVKNTLDCDDSDSDVSPDATEICGDGLDNDCDGTATGCSPWGQESLGGHSSVDGDKADELGVSVAIVGDVDQDGDVDFAIGATQGASSTAGGQAEVFYDDLLKPHKYTWSTLRSDVGAAIAGGDLDDDGDIDLLIGGPNDDSGQGTVLVAEGPLDDGEALSGGWGNHYGAGASVAVVDFGGDGEHEAVWGEPDNSRLGYGESDEGHYTAAGSTALGAALGVVDLDGDGGQELVASDLSGAAVYHYDGGGGTDLASAGLVISAEETKDELGYSIGSGDLDGDGDDELVLGARGEGTGGGLSGAVYLLSSVKSGGVASQHMAKLTGEVAGDQAGTSVAVTDLDGDGQMDLAIGAPGSDRAVAGAGAVFVFYGPITADAGLDQAHAMLTGQAGGEEAGSALTGGDVDGDGYGDLIVGAPGASGGGSLSGGAYLVMGGAW